MTKKPSPSMLIDVNVQVVHSCSFQNCFFISKVAYLIKDLLDTRIEAKICRITDFS